MTTSTYFETQAIHAGLTPDPTTGAILTPIHQTTTYRQAAVGEHKGYTYTRAGNPTVAALERNLGALEGASEPAVCFASGMAAISTLLVTTLSKGDHIILSEVIYGGTVRLVRQVLSRFGIDYSFVDTTNLDVVRNSFRPNTKLVLIETPANPTLVLADIQGIAEICKTKKCPLAVDNTFLTAALQKPLDLGADIVVYSTTKYIEGHNSTIGGAIVSNDAQLIKDLRFHTKTLGCPQSPFEAWLTLKGVKTLSLRIRQHSENALKVAHFLETHPKIDKVFYPFLPNFPQYELAQKQQKTGGGIISFELKGGTPAGIKLLNSVKLCALAENLGAVETLITHPVSMTHGDVPVADRLKAGITDGLVRLSVGLEAPEDIIADLKVALEKC